MVIDMFSLPLAVNSNMFFSLCPSVLSFSKILSFSAESSFLFAGGFIFVFNFCSIFFSVGFGETPFYFVSPVKLISGLFYLMSCCK